MKTFGSSFPGCVYVTAPQPFWTSEISATQDGLWKDTSTCGARCSLLAGTTGPLVMNTVTQSSPPSTPVLTLKHSPRAPVSRNIDWYLLTPALSHYSTYQLEKQIGRKQWHRLLSWGELKKRGACDLEILGCLNQYVLVYALSACWSRCYRGPHQKVWSGKYVTGPPEKEVLWN